jgi:hypothetical protein
MVAAGPTYESTASPVPDRPARGWCEPGRCHVEMPGPSGDDVQTDVRVRDLGVDEPDRERPVVAAERCREDGRVAPLPSTPFTTKLPAPSYSACTIAGSPTLGGITTTWSPVPSTGTTRDRRRGGGGHRAIVVVVAAASGGSDDEHAGEQRERHGQCCNECRTRGRERASSAATDWQSGTHLDRFACSSTCGRSVLDVGAGSGINRPDWMRVSRDGRDRDRRRRDRRQARDAPANEASRSSPRRERWISAVRSMSCSAAR